LLKHAIRLSNKTDQVKPKDYERLKTRLYARLEQLIETSSDDKDVTRLIKQLRRHREELFTFLEYKGVSPYNNHAEQQMRKPVISRKMSQQIRSGSKNSSDLYDFVQISRTPRT
jgi:hypothetical protein